jgi:5'-deoxynucleotidase YfbR-like HD superfamily hydrolase
MDGSAVGDRAGDWMMTFTQRQFWPLDPRVEDVDVRDIAHALAHQCRYNGHSACFYSVAEHSVLLADRFSADRYMARYALLHDAAEAYLGDIIRPLKPFLPGFAEVEQKVERVIFDRFGLVDALPLEVKLADTRILMDERNALFDPEEAERLGWRTGQALGVTLLLLGPDEAEAMFLDRFGALFPEHA